MLLVTELLGVNMKPMGRAYFKGKDSKHKIKINGKWQNWWSNICAPNKTREKRQARIDINNSY
jgi:hypothetical protein